MASLLFLAHRMPYPPDKGDKIRSWHVLRFLAERFQIFLGCFVDDPDDWRHEEKLRALCADCRLLPLNRRLAGLRSLSGLLAGQALSVPYFHDARLQEWVNGVLARSDLAGVYAYSSPMMQYLMPRREIGQGATLIADFVDVDSEKWRQYADARSWPSNWIYGREARKLLQFERLAADAADLTLFVSVAEAALFRRTATAGAAIGHMNNGVDADYFSPDHGFDSPFSGPGPNLVFTGMMDYWANVDAVTWFTGRVLPELRAAQPNIRFHIVGARPTAAVRALGKQPGVSVTGRVEDVRPYLAHADAVVAPLRIARGVQNKVLEAMAMARPVVASGDGLAGIAAEPGQHLMIADRPDEFVAAVLAALQPDTGRRLGQAARTFVLEHHVWSAVLNRLVADFAGAR